jgi:hypothetical protein
VLLCVLVGDRRYIGHGVVQNDNVLPDWRLALRFGGAVETKPRGSAQNYTEEKAITHLSLPDSFMPVEGLRQGCKGYALYEGSETTGNPVHVNHLRPQESLLLGDNFVSDTVEILRSVTPRGSRKVELHSLVGNANEFLGQTTRHRLS